ncbi:hypothetical protein KKF84_08030, partial [Myxococcota bacterium]|nr:hypothetical protein [Myxococcota bacterium]
MKTLAVFMSFMFFWGCDVSNSNIDTCGDGVIDVGEECDGANLGSSSCNTLGYHGGILACDENCRYNITECEASGQCGDGTIQTEYGEECEEGLSDRNCSELGQGDGIATCDENCQWDYSGCSGASSCGDNTIEGSEQCEGTNLNDATCESLGFYGGTLSCDESCMYDEANCHSFGYCGDGIAQTNYGEDCDDEALQDASCESLGYYAGTLACTEGCLYDTSNCETFGICGDTIIQTTNGEECDGTNFDARDCVSEGGYRGSLSCTNDCEIDISGCERCGDGVVQSIDAEECDGTNFDGATCESLGQLHGGNLTCTASCTLDLSGCNGLCGDGTIQAGQGEECDGTNLNSATCENMGHLYGGTLACGSGCLYDLSGCNGWCGDGTVQGGEGEECDGGNLDGATCENLGHLHGGTLECGAGCVYDLSGCNGWCGDGAVQISEGEQCDGSNLNGRYCLLEGTLQCDSTCLPSDSGCNAFVAVQASIVHTCGITSAGAAFCWGENGSGQLGDGTTTNSKTANAVTGGLTFTEIHTAAEWTCALTTSGAALCWGKNNNGQLGDGTVSNKNIPTAVSGGLSFQKIHTGNESHSCGITTSGAAYCWGLNNYGQLGDGSYTQRYAPYPVSGSFTFTDLALGRYFSCGLDTSGQILCWGQGNYGQLGSDANTEHDTPEPVSGGLTFVSITAGYDHACALTATGAAYCWGKNDNGEVGDGTFLVNRMVPTQVAGGHQFQTLSAGRDFTCGITTVGTAYCWGKNYWGTLGDGTTSDHSSPAEVSGENMFLDIA